MRYQSGIMRGMAMTLRLTDEQAAGRFVHARSMGGAEYAAGGASAVDDYLTRAADDEQTDRLAEQGARHFADLLRRLGE